jgi:hypothetical protein
MSWTVVDDNGVLQVRASIADRTELLVLIENLTKRSEDGTFKTFEKESTTDD